MRALMGGYLLPGCLGRNLASAVLLLEHGAHTWLPQSEIAQRSLDRVIVFTMLFCRMMQVLRDHPALSRPVPHLNAASIERRLVLQRWWAGVLYSTSFPCRRNHCRTPESEALQVARVSSRWRCLLLLVAGAPYPSAAHSCLLRFVAFYPSYHRPTPAVS